MPNYIKLGNLRIEIPEPAPVDPGDGGGGGGGGGGGSSSLLTGLLAFYNLSDLTDASGNGNTLTNNGGVTFSAGKIGNAANHTHQTFLQGSDELFPMGNSNRTMSVWFKTSDNHGFRVFYGNSSANNLFGLYSDGAVFAFSGWANDYNTVISITDGLWHHGVVVHDSENGLTLYLDGVSVGTYATSLDTTSGEFLIGRAQGGTAIPPGVASCNVDAVGIWNRALTSAEIAELYNAGAGKEHPFA